YAVFCAPIDRVVIAVAQRQEGMVVATHLSLDHECERFEGLKLEPEAPRIHMIVLLVDAALKLAATRRVSFRKSTRWSGTESAARKARLHDRPGIRADEPRGIFVGGKESDPVGKPVLRVERTDQRANAQIAKIDGGQHAESAQLAQRRVTAGAIVFRG